MTGENIKEALQTTVTILEEIGLPYAVIGALTLGFYGEGRATRDVDLLVDGNRASLDQVRAAAAQRGITEDTEWLEQNPGLRYSHVRLMHGVVPVDVMLPRDDQDRSACGRRHVRSTSDRNFWVVTPEDFILQKLKAGRPRDFDDAIPFFIQQRGQLDHEYLNQWALRLGVREELDYLWSQSERATES